MLFRSIAEEEFETCVGYGDTKSCSDVGNCDGISCILASECVNGYCVHESCWNKPYKEGDGFCDVNNGENNKNSQIDCACADNERWDTIAQKCETYCGNGFCEASEVGICKEDCQFCGDGQCSNNEDCRICETDCGVCENEELNEEVSERIRGGVEESIKGANSRQKNVTLGAIAAIVLFIMGYFYLK